MTIKTEVINKFIDEYKSQQSTYKEFGKIISKIIRVILKNNEFRYQIVSRRPKGINSLRRKNIENKKYQKLKTIPSKM